MVCLATFYWRQHVAIQQVKPSLTAVRCNGVITRRPVRVPRAPPRHGRPPADLAAGVTDHSRAGREWEARRCICAASACNATCWPAAQAFVTVDVGWISVCIRRAVRHRRGSASLCAWAAACKRCQCRNGCCFHTVSFDRIIVGLCNLCHRVGCLLWSGLYLLGGGASAAARLALYLVAADASRTSCDAAASCSINAAAY